MQRLIFYNWLILAVASLLVCVYISIFEDFVKDKAYMYLLLALVFGFVYYKQRSKS